VTASTQRKGASGVRAAVAAKAAWTVRAVAVEDVIGIVR